jgi:hypothetical protein
MNVDCDGVDYLWSKGTPLRLREIATMMKPIRLIGKITSAIAESIRKLTEIGPPSPWKLPPDRPNKIKPKTPKPTEKKIATSQLLVLNSLAAQRNDQTANRQREGKKERNSTV